MEILNARIFGNRQNVLRMQVVNAQGVRMNAVYFGGVQEFLEFLVNKYDENKVDMMLSGQRSGIKVSLTYYPTTNEYMGKTYLQIVIGHYQ